MIEIGINSEILAQILDGRKTIEGRLAKGKFLALKPGDDISVREDMYVNGTIIETHDSAAKLHVIDIEKFSSFNEILVAKGFEKVIPNAKSIEEARSEYERYYSSDDEKEYGVLGISFRVVL